MESELPGPKYDDADMGRALVLAVLSLSLRPRQNQHGAIARSHLAEGANSLHVVHRSAIKVLEVTMLGKKARLSVGCCRIVFIVCICVCLGFSEDGLKLTVHLLQPN